MALNSKITWEGTKSLMRSVLQDRRKRAVVASLLFWYVLFGMLISNLFSSLGWNMSDALEAVVFLGAMVVGYAFYGMLIAFGVLGVDIEGIRILEDVGFMTCSDWCWPSEPAGMLLFTALVCGLIYLLMTWIASWLYR